ncbi:T9SS type A sorting domain-containing protein [Flammeovirga pectinis]|uniref:T9SS type A sorting domain-containing protein n=1 Tax=Flammeovirga pectinis TaxID=2494373 RepID=A0A3S9P678_9BACT|nr:T9SS type A sorting domain-containing protein [Flammeovirga pectinis]AZQ63720.1 T9SS type A sorting domain-containing protein [Flammeovirga pectinis]
MNLKQLLSIGIILISTFSYAQQISPQDFKKSEEQLLSEKHEQEILLEERENRLLKEKHALEYSKVVESAKKHTLQLDLLSKEDRIKLQVEKELQENPFAVIPEKKELKRGVFVPSQLKFKTDTINLSKGRFSLKGLNTKEEQTVSFSERDMPTHLVQSFIDFAPQTKRGLLLKHRNDWVAEKIPSLLSKNTIEKSNKAFGLGLDSLTKSINIPLTDKEFIGKSGSRTLEEDAIILQLDSTVWYEHIADNDSVLTRKIYTTFNELGENVQHIEYRKNGNGELKVFLERNYLRDENGFLAEIETKENINGVLTTISITRYTWSSDIEYEYEYYSYNKNSQELEPNSKSELKLYTSDDNVIRLDFYYEYTFNKVLQTWIGQNGRTYTYDENGHVDSYMSFEWHNHVHGWAVSNSFEYINDDNGNHLTSLEKSYSRVEESLVNSYKNIYAYDENENRILEERFRWNKPSQEWEGEYKVEETFNENVQVSSRVSYDWSVDDMNFVADHKYEYTYFPDGSAETSVRYYWSEDLNEFIPDYRQTSAHLNGMQILSISEYYDTNKSEWVKNYKYEYAFDDLGNSISFASYYGEGDVWMKDSKSESIFDNKSQLLEGITYHSENNEWILYSKEELAYDENNNRIMYSQYFYSEGIWLKSYKEENSFDEEGRTLLSNYAYNDGDNNWLYHYQNNYEYPNNDTEIRTYQTWNINTDDWLNSTQYTYINRYNFNSDATSYWDSENNNWGNDWKHEYTYNENGDEVEVADYKGEGTTWVNHWLKKYEYNSNDLLTKIEEFESADSDWATTAIATKVLEYDNEDRLTLEERVAPDDWGSYESYKHEFEYNENGIKLLEVYLFGKSGAYVSGSKNERARKVIGNVDNYTILDAYYDWSSEDQDWVGDYKYEYDYDDNGNQILNKHQNYLGNTWVNSWESRYAFDDNDYITMYSYRSSWDTDLNYYTYGYRSNYLFNELNQKTQSLHDNFNDGSWVKRSRNNYLYDSEGRQSQEIYSYWSSETSKYRLSSKRNWNYLNDRDYDYTYFNYTNDAWVIYNQQEVRYNVDTFVKTETVFDASKGQKISEYKYCYASSNFNTQLKSIYTDFQNSYNNEITLIERHFNQDYFRITYNLKVSNDSLIDSNKNNLVIEDSTASVLTSRTYYTNTNTFDDPVWVELEKYMYEFTDGVQSGITQYSHDGTIFVPEKRYSMTYSEDEDVYTSISYEINGSEFEKHFKSEFKKNDDGQTIEHSSYHWSSDQEMWIGDYRYDHEEREDKDGYTYIKYATYYWDYSNNVWEGRYSYENKSKTNGNKVASVHFVWDYDNLDWALNYKNEFIYNDEQVKTSEISYNWSDKQQEWIGDRKRDYDGDRTAYSEWKFSDNTWQYVEAYTFTIEGEVSTRIHEEWITDTWVNNNKIINTNGDLDIYEYYDWSANIGDWCKIFKNTHYINKEEQSVHEYAIGGNDEWENIYRNTVIDYNYSGDISFSLSIYEEWNGSKWIKDHIKERLFNYYNPNKGYTAIYKYDSEINEFVPYKKTVENDAWEYTWNAELEDWLGIREQRWGIETYNERWDNELGKWILHEKEYYMYSPVITYDLPSAVSINETPSMEMNILTTAPGLALTTSGAATVDGLTVTFEEAGTLELTISTPAGETSYGTPYTAREIKAEMLVEKTEEALALDNVTLASDLLVYPNPSSDFVKVSVSAGTIISKIDLFTISGVNKGSTFNSLIDVKGLSQGVYILRISTNKGVASKTLVVK